MMEDISVVKKWLSLVFAILETFLLGGIMFGWASLVYMLKRDGVYSHLCGGGGERMGPIPQIPAQRWQMRRLVWMT